MDTSHDMATMPSEDDPDPPSLVLPTLRWLPTPKPSRNHSRSIFLSVPLEIRRHIYHLCIPTHRVYTYTDKLGRNYWDRSGFTRDAIADEDPLDSPSKYWHGVMASVHSNAGTEEVSTSGPLDAFPSLALLCRQISHEVKEVFHGENTFVIHDWMMRRAEERYLFGRFCWQTTMPLMRSLILTLSEPGILRDQCDIILATDEWTRLVRKLAVVGIVVKPRLQLSEHNPCGLVYSELWHNLPLSLRWSDCYDVFKPQKYGGPIWESYLTRTLGQLVDNLSDSALILVDDHIKDSGECKVLQAIRDVIGTVFKDRFRYGEVADSFTYFDYLDDALELDDLTYHHLDIRRIRAGWDKDSGS